MSRFTKRSQSFIQISRTQALPMLLHLHDRRKFTEECLDEVIQVLGTKVLPRFWKVEGNTKALKIEQIQKRSSPERAESFVTTLMNFSYYFQPTFPTQYLLIDAGQSGDPVAAQTEQKEDDSLKLDEYKLEEPNSKQEFKWKGLDVLEYTIVVSSKAYSVNDNPSLAMSHYFSDRKKPSAQSGNVKKKRQSRK